MSLYDGIIMIIMVIMVQHLQHLLYLFLMPVTAAGSLILPLAAHISTFWIGNMSIKQRQNLFDFVTKRFNDYCQCETWRWIFYHHQYFHQKSHKKCETNEFSKIYKTILIYILHIFFSNPCNVTLKMYAHLFLGVCSPILGWFCVKSKIAQIFE